MFAFRELVLVADLLAAVMECNRQLGLLDELPVEIEIHFGYVILVLALQFPAEHGTGAFEFDRVQLRHRYIHLPGLYRIMSFERLFEAYRDGILAFDGHFVA